MFNRKSDNYDKFHCIMGACPNSCCSGGWQIIIDDEHLERYSELAEAGKIPETGINWKEKYFNVTGNGDCRMLTPEGLCSLQKQYGEDMLCNTCARYPRHVEEFDGVREWSLSLSCPEAARMLLSRTEPLAFSDWETAEEEDEEEYEDFDDFLYSELEFAREKLYAIIQDRSLKFRDKAGAMAALAEKMQLCIDEDRIFEMDEIIDSFDPAAEASDAAFRDPFDKNTFSKLFELEMLSDEWPDIIDRTWQSWDKCATSGIELSDENEIRAEQLLMFWIYTYFCGAVYDGWIYSKVMLAVCSVYWIFVINAANGFKRGITEASYRYAREIEHSDENLDALEEWFMGE